MKNTSHVYSSTEKKQSNFIIIKMFLTCCFSASFLTFLILTFFLYFVVFKWTIFKMCLCHHFSWACHCHRNWSFFCTNLNYLFICRQSNKTKNLATINKNECDMFYVKNRISICSMIDSFIHSSWIWTISIEQMPAIHRWQIFSRSNSTII